MDMLKQISLAGLVPVIKIEDANDAVPLCQALSEGGLPVAEITFRTSAAEQSIANVHEALPDVLLGAGTVLSVDQVKSAVAAGAKYIVSPGFNPEVVGYCVDNAIPILPGCSSPSDLERALSFGLQTVKFFPAEALGGLKLIKAMSAPYGSMSFVPTGGINEKNVLEYLSFPKVIAVGGSWMVPDDALKAKDWDKVTRLTRAAVDLLLGLEIVHIGINENSLESALEDATLLAKLFGWEVSERAAAYFVGKGFEVLKKTLRGAHGHIAIQTNSMERAVWHLKRRGFVFDAEPTSVKDGKTVAIYLEKEIAGFALHLLAK